MLVAADGRGREAPSPPGPSPREHGRQQETVQMGDCGVGVAVNPSRHANESAPIRASERATRRVAPGTGEAAFRPLQDGDNPPGIHGYAYEPRVETSGSAVHGVAHLPGPSLRRVVIGPCPTIPERARRPRSRAPSFPRWGGSFQPTAGGEASTRPGLPAAELDPGAPHLDSFKSAPMPFPRGERGKPPPVRRESDARCLTIGALLVLVPPLRHA